MMAQARLRKASWMPSRTPQRMRSRRNQCSSAMDCSTTPPVGAQARAVPRSATGDHGRDALLTYLLAVLVMVIPAVGLDPFRAPCAAAAAAAHGGMASIRGLSWVMSWRLPSVSDTASRMPCASVIRWRLEPGPGKVDRARVGFGPPLTARTCELSMTARDQSRAGRVQLTQQRLVQVLPYPGFLPVAQPPPAGHPDPKPSSWGRNSHGSPCTGQTGSPTMTQMSDQVLPGMEQIASI